MERRFKLDGRYLSLSEIERLYESNHIRRSEIVEIATYLNGETIYTPYELNDLIHIYGAEYPFRRETWIGQKHRAEVSDFSSSDDEKEEQIGRRERRKSVTFNEMKNEVVHFEKDDLESVCTAEITQDQNTSIPTQNLIFEKIDIPLYNSKYEDKDNRITGKELENEMRKLREKAPLPWNNDYNSVFEDLKNTKDSMILCRFCDFNPYTPKNAIEHLFDQNHLKKLLSEEISPKSIEYWHQRFEAAKDANKSIIVKGAQKQAAKLRRIPLLQKQLGGKTTHNNLEKLAVLEKSVDLKDFGCPTSYFPVFVKAVGSVEKCEYCENVRFTNPSAKSVLKHIVSKEHLKNAMKLGYNGDDFGWWCNVLRQAKKVEVKKVEEVKGRNGKRRTDNGLSNVPLLTKAKNQKETWKSKRQSYLKRLDILYRSVDKARLNNSTSTASKSLNKMLITKESCQFGCETPLRSTDAYSIITHCLTSPHREKLIEKGFSQADFEFWSNNLNSYLKEQLTNDELGVDEESTVASTTSDFSIALNNVKITSYIPLLDVSQSDCSKEEQEGYLNELKVLWNIVDATTWKQCGKKVWQRNPMATCAACNLPPSCFSDAVALGTHIFSSKHLQHLENVGFPKNDYVFWKTFMTDSLGAGKKKTRNRTSRKKKEQDVPVVRTNVTEPPVPERIQIVVPKEQQQNNEPVPVIQAENESALDLFPKFPFFSLPVDGTMEPETFAKQFSDLKSRIYPVGAKNFCGKVEKIRTCAICDRSVTLEYLGAFRDHLVSIKHCENMAKYRFSQSDFEHWEKLLANAIVEKNKAHTCVVVNALSANQTSGNSKLEKRKVLKNDPHFPLIDQASEPMDKTEFETKYQSIREKWKRVDFEQAELMVQEKEICCYICPKKDIMKNVRSIGSHICSKTHENMLQQRVTSEALEYWEKLVDELKNDRLRNHPRIPFLDYSVKREIEDPLTDEEIIEKLEEYRNGRFENKEAFDASGHKKSIRCYVCHGSEGYAMTPRLVLAHVSSLTHRENLLKIGVSRKDIGYWEELFKKPVKNEGKRLYYPLGLMYANIDFLDRKFSDVLSEEQVAEKYKQLREQVAEVEKSYQFDFNTRFKLLHLQHDRKFCTWCHNPKPVFHAPFHFLRHVSSEEHEKKVKKYCKIRKSDFDEWFDKIKIFKEFLGEQEKIKEYMEQKIKREMLEKEEEANRKRLIEEEKRRKRREEQEEENRIRREQEQELKRKREEEEATDPYCRLPLFIERATPGTPCDGTFKYITNARRAVNEGLIDLSKKYSKPCRYCNEIHPTRHSLILHATSVKHLKNVSDFVQLVKIVYYSYHVRPTPPWYTIDSELDMPLFSPRFANGVMIFVVNSTTLIEIQKVVETLDDEKFDVGTSFYNNLTKKGCHTCDVWLPTASSVARHALSGEHLENLRLSGFPVTWNQIYFWLERIKAFKKVPPSLCSLM